MKKRLKTSEGGPSVRRASGSVMFSEQAWTEIAHSLKLSKRELQILHGVFDGCTEFAIASELRISPHTVHSHIERLHNKLAVTDRVELVLVIITEFLRLTLAPGTTLLPICAHRAAGCCPLPSALS